MKPPNERRPAAEGDVDGMVAVLQAAFPRWPAIDISVTPAEHLRWKMASHPAVENGHLIGLADGEVTGLMVQLARDMNIRGETLVAQSIGDVALHPSLQGTGLVREATPDYEVMSRGRFDLSINTESNHPSMRAIAASRGNARSIANPLRTLARGVTVRTTAGVRWHSARWRGLPFAARDALRRLPAPRIAIETIESFDERVDDLWHEAAPTFDLIGKRDAAFLNWRYADRRGGDSLIRVATEESAAVGYSVLRWTKAGPVIADILARPERLDVVHDLAADAARQSRAHGQASIGCMLPERHPYRDVLLGLGFLDIGRSTAVKYSGGNLPTDELAFLEDPDTKVHITAGDFDYI